MRIGYLDCFSGASGDMMLGALVDAGVEPSDLERDLGLLGIDGYALCIYPVMRAGLGGTRVEVRLEEGRPPHRTLADIMRVLEASRLSPKVREQAAAVFERLARAEARVHRQPVERVHFHEVGAVDAIVDVVGTVAGVERLGIERLLCSPLPVGPGKLRGAHGDLPLPAPATLELLRGFAVTAGPAGEELVTPTGAALVASLAEPSATWPAMTVECVGYGAGARDLPTPNLLRLVVGQDAPPRTPRPEDLPPWSQDAVTVLEANVDDVSPQETAHLVDRLLEAGALDAWMVPVVMKKGRSGVTVCALTRPEDAPALAAVCFREGVTPGLRWHPTLRFRLPVEELTLETAYGSIRVRRVRGPRGVLRVWPEYEDCRAAARAAGVPLSRVMWEAREAGARSQAEAREPGSQQGGERDRG